MDSHLVAAVSAAVGSGALGALLPRVIARLPEPVLEGPDAGDGESELPRHPKDLPPPPDKELYADLARTPRLALKLGVSAAAVGAAMGAALGRTGVLPVWIYLAPLGVALAFLDWRTTYLPTRLIAPSYAVVIALLLLASFLDDNYAALIPTVFGWLLIGGLYFLLWALAGGIGYGDVRLSGLLGLALGYLGWPEIAWGGVAMAFVPALAQIVMLGLKLGDRRRHPYGPFMLLGVFIAVVALPSSVPMWGG